MTDSVPNTDRKISATQLAEAKRALLERWLGLIRDAVARRDRELEARIEAAKGKSVTPPPLQIPSSPSRDMIDLLTNGIEAALAGSKDPFGIAAPRGIKPLLNRQKQIEAVSEVIAKLERNPRGNRVIVFESVGKKYNVGMETIRNLYYDQELRQWAEGTIEAYRNRRHVRPNSKKSG